MTIRVLIADDQAVVRAGFRVILGAATDIEVVGEAADGLAATQRAATLRPDVVLMDIQMPGCDGIEATRRIAALEGQPVRVLVVTTFDLDEYVYEALRAGASGFVLKDIEPDDLVTGVRTIHTGHALLAPAVTGRLIQKFIQAAQRPGHSCTPAAGEPSAGQLLTQREREVLTLVARGMSNGEIAEQMYVAETTVKTHVGHMLRKLDLRDRVQLVVFAFETGLAASESG
ncbi:MAG: response regulator [Pseudonocardiaceae bacterium]